MPGRRDREHDPSGWGQPDGLCPVSMRIFAAAVMPGLKAFDAVPSSTARSRCPTGVSPSPPSGQDKVGSAGYDRRFDGWFSMRSAALTLMALAVLSACAETTDAVAPASGTGVSYPGYYGTTDNGTPFFTTTDPANFANPSAYAGDPGVIAMAPYYAGNAGYFILPARKAHYAYCPPRGGRSYSHARGGGRHR